MNLNNIYSKLDLMEYGIRSAEKIGADQVEVFLTDERSKRTQIEAGKVTQLQSQTDSGASIRLVKDNALGSVIFTDLTKTGVKKAVGTALELAKVKDPSFPGFPEPRGSQGIHLIPGSDINGLDDQVVADSSIEMIESAKAYDKRVSPTDGIFSSSIVMTMIVNSNGISLVDIGSKFICSVRSRVKEGVNIGNGYDYSISRKYSSLIPKRVSEKSAELSVTSIKKKMIPSGNYKIILDPHAFADIVKGLLIPAALGVNVQHKSSFLSERLGEIVAGSNFTLIDDGTLNSGINASYMDHEGTLTGKTKIIDNGMLTGWLYDYYSACKEHRESTGNGIRFLSPIFDKIYRFTPQAEGTNTILLPGSATRNELIEEVYDGILVSFLVGSWSFNYSNGTFSADARNCYRIEKGEISYAVDEATIHGNVIDLIKDLQIGNNSTQSRGCIPLTPAAVITPTVVAENVSIGA